MRCLFYMVIVRLCVFTHLRGSFWLIIKEITSRVFLLSHMYTCISIWFIPWSPKLYSHCTICTNVKLTIFIHDINQELKQFECYLTYVIFHLYRELKWWSRIVRIKHLNADLLCFGNTTHFEAGSVDPTTVAFPMKSD